MTKKCMPCCWLSLSINGRLRWLGGILLVIMLITPLQAARAQAARSVDMIMNGLATELAQRFPAVSGDVVQVEGEQIYLSLGARDNLLQGTQLTVLREGEVLKHPTSGETLGRVETALGVVTVIQVAEHYAVATLTQRTGDQDVRRGDKVRITSGRIALGLLPVVAQPPLQVSAPGLTEALRRALEATDRFRVAAQDQTSIWLLQRGEQPEGGITPDLVPELAQALGVSYVLLPRVRELQGTALLDLQIVSPSQPYDAIATASALLPETSLAHRSPVPPVPVPGLTQQAPTLEGISVPPAPSATPTQPAPAQKPTPEPRQNLYSVFKTGPQSGLGSVSWNLADTLTELSRFSLPVRGIDGSDIDGDGIIEVAVLMASEILLYRLEGEQLALIDTFAVRQGTLLSVQLLRLGDRIGVVVNREMGTARMDSFVLILQEQRLVLWQEHLDDILLAVDTDGDSVNDRVWGQPFDTKQFFREGMAQEYVLADGKLSPQDRVTLPYLFRATGAALAQLRREGQRHLVMVDTNHRLRVYRGKEELWKSPEDVGGSNIYGETRETISRDEMVSYFYFEPIPAVMDVNGDGIEEVLVPRNVGKVGFVPNITSFSSGDVMLLREEKYGYTLSSISPQFNGVVSGVVALPGNPPVILIAVTKHKSFPSRGGESWLYLSRVPVS